MAKNDIFTQDRVRQLLEYDPETGVFRWKWRDDVGLQWNRKNAGKVAGHVSVHGHVHLMINKQRCYAHRIAWLYMTGEYPPGDIDHINGNRADNRLENLRPASRTQNNYNRKIQSNNAVGVKGVYRHRGKFRSQIVCDGKVKHIGVFKTIDEAKAAYSAAAQQYHGEYAYRERHSCPTSSRHSSSS